MRRTLGRRGEGYIDTAVSAAAVMMIAAAALNIFGFLTLKQDMDYFAGQMIDAAAVCGSTEAAEERYGELREETGLSPLYSFGGTEYFDPETGKVQLGDTIKVTLSCGTRVLGLGPGGIPVTLSASCSGLSRRYWK